MSYYEKGEYFIQEKHIVNGMSRERVDEEQWTKGIPKEKLPERMEPRRRSTNGCSLPERSSIARERVVDDYRRVDYSYADQDGFFVKRPLHSPQFTRPNVIRPSVVSRPGSPGPVAGTGDITNTEHGFTIQLDVKHFNPEEIKVVLTKDLLCVSGERTEISCDGQSLRRSFARKYSIPSDIMLDSIRSHLGDDGFLIINGSRRGWKETNICVHAAPAPGARRAGSVISTV